MEGKNSWECEKCKLICDESTGFVWMEKVELKSTYRGYKIVIQEEFDGYSDRGFSYRVLDAEDRNVDNSSDETWWEDERQAIAKAKELIDGLLDKDYIISCLVTKNKTKHHFPMTYFGTKDGAIEKACSELNQDYPGWKHSIVARLASEI
jgi:hypothetical protein